MLFTIIAAAIAAAEFLCGLAIGWWYRGRRDETRQAAIPLKKAKKPKAKSNGDAAIKRANAAWFKRDVNKPN
jgi:hypothetical protein